MPIPQSQLETWSGVGATTSSANAYNSIRTALLKQGSPARASETGIFLQGSYANSTNIYGDSDVDVVVLYENTFHKDMTRLSQPQRDLHEATYSKATYTWDDHFADVLKALQGHFGDNNVARGKKSIKIKTAYGTKPSDVVPVVEYRRYEHFNGTGDLSAHWGVYFRDSIGQEIINYPKYHKERGEDKNKDERTKGKYKATVRIFKNLRNYLLDKSLLASKDVAPSYFLECALFTVPDEYFIGAFSDTIPAIIDFLRGRQPNGLLCQNGVTELIGTDSTQWKSQHYMAFANAARHLWDNWYDI